MTTLIFKVKVWIRGVADVESPRSSTTTCYESPWHTQSNRRQCREATKTSSMTRYEHGSATVTFHRANETGHFHLLDQTGCAVVANAKMALNE